MKIKIERGEKMDRKFIGVILFFGIVIFSFVIFYLVNVSMVNSYVEKIMRGDVWEIEKEFNHFEKLDTKTLASSLEVIIQDQKIKEIYLEKDREKLYSHTSPLFEELKSKYGVTHWYFILPDGHTFLRVHNKDIYGDEITRFTFWKSRDTKDTASGIELGKTAYALRVVMPYYDGNKLIGYVELGEEIEHFFDLLEKETGDEFMLAVKKEYLNENKWSSVKSVAGLRNNWNDSRNYVLIYPLDIDSGSSSVLECFNNENMLNGERGRVVFQEIEDSKCAGFPLIDAGNRRSGMVLVSMDIENYNDIKRNSNLIIIGFLVLIFIIIGIASYFLFSQKEKNEGKKK